MAYNIAKRDGTLMLVCWVDTYREADEHLQHYLTKYAPGSPYPNGKGFYPDWGFHIISENEAKLSISREVNQEIDAKLGEIFYAIGLLPPRYPVPAIPLKVVVGQEEYWDTVYIEDITDPESPYIVCMWDFNWDRCMDFGTKYGQYMNSREVEETVYVPISSSV